VVTRQGVKGEDGVNAARSKTLNLKQEAPGRMKVNKSTIDNTSRQESDAGEGDGKTADAITRLLLT
jgi:hypothetical protein